MSEPPAPAPMSQRTVSQLTMLVYLDLAGKLAFARSFLGRPELTMFRELSEDEAQRFIAEVRRRAPLDRVLECHGEALRALPREQVAALAEALRSALAGGRSRPVLIADDSEYYEQVGGDFRAASSMADRINEGLARDRDRLVERCAAVPTGDDALAHVTAVMHVVMEQTNRSSDYESRVGHLVESVIHDALTAHLTAAASVSVKA